MGNEIEKKFLLGEDGVDYATAEFRSYYPGSLEQLKQDVISQGESIKQGYMSLSDGQELSDLLGLNADFNPSEARLRNKSGKLYFTIKGKGGLSRNELEATINETYFNLFWDRTEGHRVEKVRLELPYQGHTLEVDVYTDRDLIVAEIEFTSVEKANSLKPLGLDVTEDHKYKNKNLAK